MALSSSVPVVEQEQAISLEQYPSLLFDLQVPTYFPVELPFAT